MGNETPEVTVSNPWMMPEGQFMALRVIRALMVVFMAASVGWIVYCLRYEFVWVSVVSGLLVFVWALALVRRITKTLKKDDLNVLTPSELRRMWFMVVVGMAALALVVMTEVFIRVN